MTRIAVPEAPLGGGAIARPVQPRGAGAVEETVARFGDALAEAGGRLEQRRLALDLARQRNALSTDVLEARLEFEREAARPGRPSTELDAAWAARVSELREARIAAADPRNRDSVGIAFDEVAGRHAATVGARLIERDRDQAAAVVTSAGVAADRALGSLDSTAAETALDAYADTVADLAAQGLLPGGEAQAIELVENKRAELYSGLAVRMLEADPRAFARARAEGAEWTTYIPPDRAAAYDARALRLVEALDAEQAREAETAALTDARARAEAAIRDDPDGFAADVTAGARWLQPFAPDELERMRTEALAAITRRDAAAGRAAEAADAAKQSELRSRLKLIADEGAERVVLGEGEALADPLARTLPEWEAAAQAVALRRHLPEFRAMPLAEMDAAITTERAREVSSRADANLLDAMIAERDRMAEKWSKDPMGTGLALYAEGGFEAAPVPQDWSDLDAAGAFVGQRVALSRKLVESGHLAEPVLFTAAERATLKAEAGLGAPPERRTALAMALAQAATLGATGAAREIEAGPVFSHVVSALAAGGFDPARAESAFRGQAAGKDGEELVARLTDRQRREVMLEVLADTVQPGEGVWPQIRATADALYADRVLSEYAGAGQTLDPKDDDNTARDLYAEAVQNALGRREAAGGAYGGAQEVNGHLTLLPPSLRPDDVRRAFAGLAALGAPKDPLGAAGPVLDMLPGPDFDATPNDPAEADAAREAAWRAVSADGGAPQAADGSAPPPELYRDLRLVPLGGGRYSLEILFDDGPAYLVDSESGAPFAFDLEALVRRMRGASR